MKKILCSIIATISMVGLSATDAELKKMLEAKDYIKFVHEVSSTQLTNLTTKAEAPFVCEAAATLDLIWKICILCDVKLIDWKSAIDITLEKQNPRAFNIAERSQDGKMCIYAIEKTLDMHNVRLNEIYTYIMKNKHFRFTNLELFKKIADVYLKNDSKLYTSLVFHDKASFTSDYVEYADSCIGNVNENTCSAGGWVAFLSYSPTSIMGDAYYFKSMWTNEKAPMNLTIYKFLQKTSYYKTAIEDIASSVKDPKSALYFANAIKTIEKSDEMIKRLYPVIAKDIHLACKVAFDLEDADKVIDILLVAKEELTADEISKMIPILNIVEFDHRKEDILKGLSNINSRYTLKLYEDSKTWEPIIAKVRAMIDLRK